MQNAWLLYRMTEANKTLPMDHVQIRRALCGVYYTRYSADRASVGRPLGRAQSMGKRVPADIRYDGVADSMRVFGVTLDRRLTFDNHASAVARPCNYHARAIRHIRHLLTLDLAQTLACSLILSRIDNCNCMLQGAPYSTIQRLQRIQNNIHGAYRSTSASTVRRQLAAPDAALAAC